MKRFKTLRNLIVIAGVLAGTGYLRMPYEQKLTEDLRERKIMQPRIQSKAWSEMGQTSLAGAFGGLRSVMAMMVRSVLAAAHAGFGILAQHTKHNCCCCCCRHSGSLRHPLSRTGAGWQHTSKQEHVAITVTVITSSCCADSDRSKNLDLNCTRRKYRIGTLLTDLDMVY